MTSLLRLEPGAVFAGDFVVERRLAEGGMGAVYVVEQRSTGHRRALKVMHPDVVADPRHRERFAQEARVGSLIRSPYVVEVTAAGVDEATGTPWLLMELLEGESLAERIARGDLPDRDTLREMAAQLGDALGRAHAAGVVHRDLKPENLFIAASRLRGVPFLMKVLDFGIAAIVSAQKQSATVTTVIGSPMWMAPEQADVGAQVGPPADVWALGLIVFYALTGRYFWPSLTGLRANFNVAALLVDIVVHPIPAPSARAAALGVGERLPPRFDAWFARCVTRDPAARFPDARAALDGLAPLLADARASAPSDPALGATLPVNAPTAAPAPVFAPAPFAAPSAPAPALPVTSAPTPAAAPPRRWPLVAAVAALTVAGAVAVALRGATPPLPAPPRGPVAAARTPAPPPPDGAPSAPADAAPARDAPALDAPALDAPVAVGHLEVTCPRRCLVTVDGVAQAVARRPLALAPGDHAVVATHGAASLTRVVRVTAGETARVTFEFATDAAARDAAAAPTAHDATAPAPRDAAVAPARDAAALPDRPDRAAVAATFRDVNAAARACGASGRVFVNADFAGDGHVIGASVEGPLAGTPTGECLARAVRQARVPPFRRATIRVSQALDL